MIDIRKIALLANLPISDKEEKKLGKELEDTLKFINSLSQVDTDDLPPTSSVTGLENISREDKVKPSLNQKDALGNAKSKYNGFFKVKGILQNE